MNVSDLSLKLTDAVLRTHILPDFDPDTPSASDRRPVRQAPPFTISISREVGALGTAVGAEIGNRLKWPVYDQEIINMIAEEMHKPSTHVRGVDERYFTWLSECLAGLTSEYHVNPSTYLKHLTGTIRSLGVKGSSVIVGRGANFILPPETTLRVRLIAELKDRVRVIGRLRGTSDADAARWIDLTEKERSAFVKANFGKDIADPLNYDLVLNTSRLSVAECAETIVHTLHQMTDRYERPVSEDLVSENALECAAGVAGR